MRIMVIPHTLELGGSQLNAIELAAAVRDQGHEVIVFGRRGQLLDRIRELKLEFVESPRPRRRPTPSIVAAIARLARQRSIDIVHAYEWPPALEAELAAVLRPSTRVLTTVMSMSVAPFLPRHRLLVVGTEEIAQAARLTGHRVVSVLEPPVDTEYNTPGIADGAAFRRAWGVPADALAVVMVARLARELKLEGTLSAIRAIGMACLEQPVRLVLVGDGPARPEIEELAAQVNLAHGADTITLTGALDDPRPAYAAADIALGMGGSALRAMAFGKPLIVQGEQGFWQTLTPETLDAFLWTGWYGVGTAGTDGVAALLTELRPQLADAAMRTDLGSFGRRTAVERFSLARAADIQINLYRRALAWPARQGALAGNVHAAAAFATHVVSEQVRKLFGSGHTDDFNAMPVSRQNVDRERDGLHRDGPIIWLSGVGWDDIPGTDRRLVEAIAATHDVIFVDSPRHGQWRGWMQSKPPAVEQPMPRVCRLRVPVLPLFTKPGGRLATRLLQRWTVRRALPSGCVPAAVVVANPVTRFPQGLGGRRVLFVTDDWIAGAGLMGLSTRWVRQMIAANAREADAVAAVAPVLLQQLDMLGAKGVPAEVLPNGAPPPGALPHGSDAVSIVIGQLNERLDLDCLEAVVAAGVRLRLVGPRADRDPDFSRRLNALLARPGVEWLDRLPPEQLARELAAARVGLTPYQITAFNQASFPLKTLDYLAAGLPVVSTDLDASHWLGSEHIHIAGSPESFAGLVVECLADPPSRADAQGRQQLAMRHGWGQRASQMLRLAGISTR